MPWTPPPLPADYDPDGPGRDSLYGLPFAPEACRVQVLPVPWELTTSYGRGTAQGPEAVLAASGQVDLYDLDHGEHWREGVGLLPAIPRVSELQEQLNEEALRVIEEGAERCPEEVARVNAASAEVNSLVQAAAAEVLARGAIPAVLGGDHSSPYGLIAALCAHHGEIGVLHIDAHADLRPGYLGFAHSHAAIFHNALQLPGLTRHVGVGWRDVGRAEIARVQAEGGRVRPYFDRDLARAVHEEGRRWSDLCDEIIEHLPPLVYVSFDIDGLEPTLCPHTGTPVPGGLSFREASDLLARLSQRRRIVGFDLCEVAPGPDEWDANVGARVLYKLAGAAIRSQA